MSIVMLSCFLLFWGGQAYTGWRVENAEREEHGEPRESLGSYLRSGGFVEATAENWESEFLQMAAYVMLTISLRQKGSSESKQVEGEEEVDEDPRKAKNKKDAPWPVRRGGWLLVLYENSLGLAFTLLFLISFVMHLLGGAAAYSQEQRMHGEPEVSALQFLKTSQFWFEAFQNWQSEFLAVSSIVILSIFLRQRGSPESKPVAAPHWETGE